MCLAGIETEIRSLPERPDKVAEALRALSPAPQDSKPRTVLFDAPLQDRASLPDPVLSHLKTSSRIRQVFRFHLV
jgi:hypothetical protein